jgi:hypothetical protein
MEVFPGHKIVCNKIDIKSTLNMVCSNFKGIFETGGNIPDIPENRCKSPLFELFSFSITQILAQILLEQQVIK